MIHINIITVHWIQNTIDYYSGEYEISFWYWTDSSSVFPSLISFVNCLNMKDKIFAPMEDDRPCFSNVAIILTFKHLIVLGCTPLFGKCGISAFLAQFLFMFRFALSHVKLERTKRDQITQNFGEWEKGQPPTSLIFLFFSCNQ